MTKTKKVFFVISVLSLLALAGAGCGGGGTATPGGEQPQGAQGGGDLAGILGLGRGITNYSYDQTIVTGNETFTATVYRKGQKMRQDATVSGQSTVMYLDMATGEIYTYMPSTKQAFKLSSGETQNSEPIDEVAGKIDPGTKIIGTETVNGENCVVVQTTVDSTTEKFWISKKYGLPMKMVSESPEGTTTTEIKNLKVGSVTDADVTLPSDAKIMELPSFGQ